MSSCNVLNKRNSQVALKIESTEGTAESLGNTDATLLVAHDNESAKTEAASPFHDFGRAIDKNYFFRQLRDLFATGCEVIGASTDSHFSHLAW